MFYQELTLMPDYGMNINHIWSRIFTQFHLAVASQMTNEKDSHIGVSFPNYFFEDKNVGLGNKLRIFAVDKEILENLNIAQWLSHCKDYVHIKNIKEVPSDVTTFATYKRWRAPKSINFYIRRYLKRHPECTVDEARNKYNANQLLQTYPPFMDLYSETNNCKYRLFIKKVSKESPNYTSFNSFGLSGESTVPEF